MSIGSPGVPRKVQRAVRKPVGDDLRLRNAMIDTMNCSEEPRLMAWTVHAAVFEVKTAEKTSGGSLKRVCASC